MVTTGSASDAPIAVDTVTLTVHDMDAAVDFYGSVLGLSVHAGGGESATLGADRPLLELRRDRVAPRRSPRDAGLFHTAFLLPTRADLGGWLRNLFDRGHRLDGAADHGVSEALYLADPEGNGVEVYRDKPRDRWPFAGDTLQMGNEPVDLGSLLAAAGPWSDAPGGTVVGHVHLQVGDLAAAEAFWTGPVGLGVTQRYPGASFFASGGYHHHVAANVWRSRGAPPLAFPRTGLTEVALRAEPAAAAAIAARAGGTKVADPWNLPIRLVETTPTAADPAA